MQLINLSLAYLLKELQPALENSLVNKIQEIEFDVFKARLKTKFGPKNLIFSPSSFYLTDYKLEAKKLTSGFGAFLNARLKNKKILSVKQHLSDRIILIGLEEYFLILELFAKGNIILADKNFEIISAYKKEQWKDREIKKGEKYKFPSSEKLSLPLKENQFSELMNSKNEAIRAIIEKVNIAPILAEEIFFLLGIDKKTPANKLSKKQSASLLEKLNEFYSLKLPAKPVLCNDVLLPFPLKHLKEEQKSFASLNEAIDEMLSKHFVTKKVEAISEKQSKNIGALEHSLLEQKKALDRFEKAVKENKEKGEWVFSHLNELKQLFEEIKKEKVMYNPNFAVKELKKNKLSLETK